MDSNDIESKPPPPVSSLRSRFEQLAVQTQPSSSKPSPQLGLLSPEQTSPRQRAVSGTQETRPQAVHLRSASSSSDLKYGAKRPPPPPPPRGAKPATSPSPSPLMRPVPIPNSTPLTSNIGLPSSSPGKSSTPSSTGDREVPTTPQLGGVASLRHKFSGSPMAPPSRSVTPNHTPRPAFANLHPTNHSEENLVDLTSPPLPPRHVKSVDTPRLASLSSPFANNLEQLFGSSTQSPRVEISSPFSDDSDSDEGTSAHSSRAPPTLPPRRNHLSSISDAHRQGSSESAMSSKSSLLSTESDTSIEDHIFLPKPTAPMRPSVIVPPPPPPRPVSHTRSSAPTPIEGGTSPIPPPLPVRRSTAAPHEDLQSPPPRLPARPFTISPEAQGQTASSMSPVMERKLLGTGRLPPPPTRTIALGEKLPPARRPPSPSSDEESDDDTAAADQLPDSSHASRRAPVLRESFNNTESRIHVPAHSGTVAVAGQTVVAGHHHHLKIYDLSVSEMPVRILDTKGHYMKDSKITCLEFRPAGRMEDRGFMLWMGTKEGHLFEVDIRDGSMTCARLGAHAHTVTHIFRHGRSMITLDSTGKTLIFTPEGQLDVHLAQVQPRVFRIAEKQEFVKMLGGLLWTSTRSDMAGSTAGTKIPIIRVYDLFVPGSVGRSVAPTEHVGAVTSGSILPSQPHNVYLGHEGGFISIWSIVTNDGIPQCIEVMNVSASDVLSLEGVGERLWAGGRKGMITAYDVVPRPWIITNCWKAHQELPVLRLATDPYSIEKLGRLCVVSVGRDEQIRLWDGLLGLDWIDHELLKREQAFSTFRDLNLLAVSWNVDAARPDALTTASVNANFLRDVLNSVDSPDIISFGFQEVIDLESRRMAAKSAILGGKLGSDDSKLSEKVSGAYKRWYDRLVSAVRLAMPPDTPYTVVDTANLVGLFSCIFIKSTERVALKDTAVSVIKRGMGGRFGNKGGIVTRFTIDDSSICMINCHLAAGQHHIRQRNADVAAMVEDKSLFPAASALDEPIAYVHGGDGTMVMDHEIVFVNGDMNYRIDYRREPIIAAAEACELDLLLAHDQLIKQMKFNRGFRFRSFSEGPLTFAPTYKYDPGTSDYDSSEKMRLPAWCDRILWRSRDPDRVEQLHYRRWEANVSDHRPISAGFKVTVKSVRHELRAMVKAEVESAWFERQRELLLEAREFYVNQALI